MRACLLLFMVLLGYLPVNGVDGFNLPGSDYANFNADSWWVCRNTCGGDSRCQAWTWVKPGYSRPFWTLLAETQPAKAREGRLLQFRFAGEYLRQPAHRRKQHQPAGARLQELRG